MGFFDALLLEAQDAVKREEEALANWKAYLATFDEKIRIVNGRLDINRLKELVRLGVTDSQAVGRDDEAIAADLAEMQLDREMEGLTRTKVQLNHEDTELRYMIRLLEHLHIILTTEDFILRQNDPKIFHTKFLEQLALEREVITQITAIPASLDIFKEYVQRFQELEAENERVKAAFRRIDHYFRDYLDPNLRFPSAIPIVHEFIGRLFAGLPDAANQALDNGEISKFGVDIDFEFVNRPMFERYAREILASMRKRDISDRLFAAIIRRFRESYNQR